jgi:ParB family chromosome partitioning protein
MSSSRNALGRGLGALLPGATPSPATTPTGATAPAPASPAAHASPTSELPLDAIDPNPEQPRRVFDDGPIETLANSIRIHGVLQPVVVRRAGERYELVVGERRWRASRVAGLDTIPAVVIDLDPQDRLEVALVENIQRRDLNPMELAVAFQTLTDSGATQEEVGRRVGMDRSSVSNYLRLLELPRPIQGDVEQGRLSMGHAKALLQESNAERRTRLRDRIVEEDLSVRAAEDLARGKPRQNRTRRERAPRDPNLERLADSLRERLQTRVRITGNGERGRIEIEYFGPEDLTRLTGALLDEVSPVG